MPEHKQWTGRTGGTPWMQRSLIAIMRRVGVRPLYAVMAFVVPFYMLFSRRSFRAIYSYYRNIWHQSFLKSLLQVYANHYAFGQIIIDRFARYAGRRFEISITNNEAFNRIATQDGGAFILGSHTGNFEFCGYCLHSTSKRLNALVFGGETATVMANRAQMWQRNNIRMIPVADDLSHLFTIHNAIEAGEIVCLTADRVFGSPKTIRRSFLGQPAAFPVGPFATAQCLHVPVLAIFVMKTGWNAYHVDVNDLSLTEAECRTLKRREQIERLADKYVAALEKNVRRFPAQWFNYYDFWETEKNTPS